MSFASRIPRRPRWFTLTSLLLCGLILLSACSISSAARPDQSAATLRPQAALQASPTPSPEMFTFAPGTQVASVAIGGLNEAEATDRLETRLRSALKPLTLAAGSTSLTLQPQAINLEFPLATLLAEARRQQQADATVRVPLRMRFNKAVLRAHLNELAQQTATEPTLQLLQATDSISRSFAYTPTRSIDVDAALRQVEYSLSTPAMPQRLRLALQSDLQADPPRPSLAQMQQEIEALAAEWEGIVGLYLHDLQSDETIILNADTVFSGASVMKVAILLYAYISMPDLDPETRQNIEAMIIDSDNLRANDVLSAAIDGSGTDDAYTSVLAMNDLLAELGLQHTYMNIPYESHDYLIGLRGLNIQGGPPQEGNPPYTSADPLLRTTPAEMARLFLLLDECSQGKGDLLSQFAEQLSADRCQEMLDLLARNADTARIVAGVPPGTRVEHKSGWTQFMHTDVGIVRSPGGDYLLAIYLWRDVEELPDVWANPYIVALSRLVYTAYNPVPLTSTD